MNRTGLCLRMLDLLSTGHWLRKEDLAEILETNVRNIKEFRKELEVAGYVIETKAGKQGGYRLARNQTLPRPMLDLDEQKALNRVFSSLLASPDPQYSASFKQTLARLGTQLQADASSEVPSAMRTRLNIDANFYRQIIDCCIQSSERCQRISFTYRKPDQSVSCYVFEPYQCVVIDAVWYVNGFIKQGDYRSFKLNRIESIIPLEEFFVRSESAFQNEMTDFGMRVKQQVKLVCEFNAYSIVSEYIWADEQKIEWIDAQRFYYEGTFPNPYSCLDFVRRAGVHCTVISPQWVAETIVQEAKAIYEKAGSHE